MRGKVQTDFADSQAKGGVTRVKEIGELNKLIGRSRRDLDGMDADRGKEAAGVALGEGEVADAGGDVGGEEVHLGDACAEGLADDLVLAVEEGGVGEVDARVDELGDVVKGGVERAGVDVGPGGDEAEDVLVLESGAGVDDLELEEVLGVDGDAVALLDGLELKQGAAVGELFLLEQAQGLLLDGLEDLLPGHIGAGAEGELQTDLGAVAARSHPSDLDGLGLHHLEVFGVQELEVEQPMGLAQDLSPVSPLSLQIPQILGLLGDRLSQRLELCSRKRWFLALLGKRCK